MEKLSIVRRRKKAANKVEPKPEPSPQAFEGEGEGRVDIPLSSAQAESLKVGVPVEKIKQGLIEAISLSLVEKGEEGSVLSLTFKARGSLHLLTGAEVCQMLRISRSTLGKMVKTGALPSYRVRGQRRFRMEEVLAYLCQESPE